MASPISIRSVSQPLIHAGDLEGRTPGQQEYWQPSITARSDRSARDSWHYQFWNKAATLTKVAQTVLALF